MSQAVVLDENDVPGAKLKHPDIEKNTVPELRRWLLCRSIKCSGVKTDLVKRVQDVINTGITEIDPKIDGGKWYFLKKQQLTSLASNHLIIPVFPKEGWKRFPSRPLPQFFNYGHIFNFFINDLADDGGETQKPLKKGQHYFTSGHVQNIFDNMVNNFYFLKSKVMSSYVTSIFYDVFVVLCFMSGSVKQSSCNCKASALGRCNHVAGLLFALDAYIQKYGCNPPACTSMLCEWNKGRSTKKDPQKVQDAVYGSCKRQKILFDPRDNKDSKNKTAADLKKSVVHLPQSGWASMFRSIFEDYIVDHDRKTALMDLRKQYLLSLRKNVPTSADPVEVVSLQGTANWYAQRSWRLTASNAKSIFTARSEETICNIINKLLWGKGGGFDNAATIYGKEMESEARENYVRFLKTRDSSLVCNCTGFWVSGLYPELGCSPDGLVINSLTSQQVGLVEIKCPYILKDKRVKHFNSELSASQKQQFCLTSSSDGAIFLKKEHAYFYQIQMQLGIMNLPWCDFMVWTQHDFFVERIYKNEELWQSLQNKLSTFFFHRFVPEFFEMRLPRKLKVIYLP